MPNMTKFQAAVKPVLWFIVAIASVSFTHWGLVNIYGRYCATTWLSTMLTMASPACAFINQVQFSLVSYYAQIWALAGVGTVMWIWKRITDLGYDVTQGSYPSDPKAAWRQMKFGKPDAKQRWNNLREIIRD